ncbi:MAG: AMP-binding protein [Pseudomonadota bacterium]
MEVSGPALGHSRSGTAEEPSGPEQTTAFPRDMLARSLRRHRERVALRFEGRELSYADLDRLSDQLAVGLAKRGVAQGDRVALLLKNAPEFVVAHLAIAKMGAVRVPLNEMLSASEVAYMIAHSGAKAVLAHAGFSDHVSAEPDVFAARPVRICVNDQTERSLPGFEAYADVLASGGDAAAPEPRLTGSDAAMILYTGGTTGRSKGVVHTQGGLSVNLMAHLMYSEIREDDLLCLCTPLPHAAHLILETALVRGACIEITAGFDPEDLCQRISAHGITYLFLVPTMIYRLLDQKAAMDADLSNLRTILYGAFPISKARLAEAIDTLGPVFVQLYGLTEAPDFVAALPRRDHLVDDYQSACGRPTVFCDVAILNPSRGPCAAGEVGEVAVRAPYTLARYHDDPERTAEAYHQG